LISKIWCTVELKVTVPDRFALFAYVAVISHTALDRAIYGW